MPKDEETPKEDDVKKEEVVEEEEDPTSEEQEAPEEDETPEDLADDLAALPEALRKKIEDRTKGLKNALHAERVAAKEGRKAQKKLSKLEAAAEEERKKGLTDAQKVEEENATLKAENDALKAAQAKDKLNTAVDVIARELLIDPTDSALADLSKVTLKDGKYVGIKEAIDALIKVKPHLAKPVAPTKSTHGTPTISAALLNGKKKEKEKEAEQPRVPVVGL